MPTTRRLRTRSRREAIYPTRWAILTDDLPHANADRFVLLESESYNDLLPYWNEHRRAILADWIKAKPGTRPSCWWRYEAPRLDPAQLGRWSRTVLAPRLIETRRKLCGEGMPLHEALNYAPSHHYGIPAWFGDPDNPPAFESQRAYLRRHGLLLPAERRQVPEPVRYPLRIEAATRWK